MSSPPVLIVDDLVASHGDTVALQGVSFEISAGEIVALIGPNGAGKSTLLDVIAGLHPPDRGSASIAALSTASGRLGYAPQDTAVYRRLTVRENLEYFAALGGAERQSTRSAVDSALKRFLLMPLASRLAEELSGGEQRRLHTAMAALGSPSLLLVDEPTVGADSETRTQLLGAVRGLAERGSAVLYTTHYLTELETLRPTRVLVLSRGRLSNVTWDQVSRHRSAFTIAVRLSGPTAPVAGWTMEGATLTLLTAEVGPALVTLLAALPSRETIVDVSVSQVDLDTAIARAETVR